GHDPRRFATDLLDRLRDLVMLRSVPDAGERGLVAAPDDELKKMKEQAGKLEPATLSRYADIVHNGLLEMRGATSPRLVLELLTARMLLPSIAEGADALLARLERLERRAASAPAPAAAVAVQAVQAAPAGQAVPVAQAPPVAPSGEPVREFQRPSQRAAAPAPAPQAAPQPAPQPAAQPVARPEPVAERPAPQRPSAPTPPPAAPAPAAATAVAATGGGTDVESIRGRWPHV
ncbi:DNA polymerase III subunit gamma/tau, partial [Amycolatopsis thailandensis]